MSKIICPECNKTISSLAKECPNCGFSMAEFLQEHNLLDTDKIWICTKCGEEDSFSTKNPICEYCKIPLVQTDIDNKNIYKVLKENGVLQYTIDLAKRYGDNFSEEAYNYRLQKIEERRKRFEHKLNTAQQPTQNVPKCPTCGSTNIEKISGSKRWFTTGLFGLGSSNVGKTMHCKNCGYKW